MTRVPSASRPWGPLLASRDGAAAVEFALLLPALCLMVAGLIDVSRLISQSMQVRAAAQAGADYAQRHGWDQAAISAAVANATTLAVAADPPQRTQACVVGQSVVATSAGACADGSKPGSFVTVRARAGFSSLMPWPDFAVPATLSGQAMVRIQ